jgi:hypothetical protein
MITSLLYAVYALAASAALVQGTRVATAAGIAVAAYLLLRLAGSLGGLLHRSAAGLPGERLGQPLAQPLGRVASPAPEAGRP